VNRAVPAPNVPMKTSGITSSNLGGEPSTALLAKCQLGFGPVSFLPYLNFIAVSGGSVGICQVKSIVDGVSPTVKLSMRML
jgi:hypothetical protein